MYTKAQVDSLLAGKANAGHMHGISLYTGTAGDPLHEPLAQDTGIERHGNAAILFDVLP